MLSLKLAFRNIFANRQRSLVIYTAMTLISMVLFLFLSFSDGEIENFTQGIEGLRTPPADLVVSHWDYLRAREAGEKSESLNKMTVSDFRALAEKIANAKGVEAVYPVTVPVTAGIYVRGKKYKDIQYLGVEVGNDPHVRDRIRITEGSYLSGKPDGLLLHASMKDDLGVSLGDAVIVTGSTLFGQALAEQFTVEGFYRSKIDLPSIFKAIYAPLAGYRLISGHYENEAPFLQVDLADSASIDSVLNELRALLGTADPGVAIHRFGDVHQQSMAVYGAIRQIIMSITLLIVFVVMFGVMNVVSTNLVDRGREIGTYYCLGASRGFLKRMYAIEILLVNLFASGTGIAIGTLTVWVLNGIGFETQDVGLQMVFGGDRLRLVVSVASIAWLTGVLLLVTAATALFSLGGALKVSPVAALRETRD
ncbi:MAG: FtsX-like permease family protein [Candidatus Competibacteraceae bacterium]|jgi:ABC-type lipoprotein release transport system permease subunit